MARRRSPVVRKLQPNLKWTSALRRIRAFHPVRYTVARGFEGDVCVFMLERDAKPIVLESPTGRLTTMAPRDLFLGTPGYRESTRWVVGAVPAGGLVPGNSYWVLADNGVVGELFGDSPLEKGYVGRVEYQGLICDEHGSTLNIRAFAEKVEPGAVDQGAPVFVVVGTSAEAGKTTAGIALLRALRRLGLTNVVTLKATGTSNIAETATYRDFGASQAFDCVDFGLPTTYPSQRPGVRGVFEHALKRLLSLPADAVLIECGGDLLGGNVPVFLRALKDKRPQAKVILAAADSLGALGGIQMLQKFGLRVSLITGPCTDTPTLQRRTGTLCRTPALNLARGEDLSAILKLRSLRSRSRRGGR